MSYPNLKTEEDVKEYLTNLYTEYKFGCYHEKRPEVCHLLGDYEEGINFDFKKAAELYKYTCDELNYGRSCAKFGGYVFYGKGCKKDENEGYNYLRKSCEQNDAKGCVKFGILSTIPDFNKDRPDREERFSEGIQALKKSCFEHEQENGCFTLGSLFISGVNDLLDKNPKEGYRAMLQACEFGNMFACANISQMHLSGEGAEKNEKLAQVFKERAVDLHEQYVNVNKSVHFQQGIS